TLEVSIDFGNQLFSSRSPPLLLLSKGPHFSFPFLHSPHPPKNMSVQHSLSLRASLPSILSLPLLAMLVFFMLVPSTMAAGEHPFRRSSLDSNMTSDALPDQCDKPSDPGDYDLSMHIAAVFIIMATSGLGAFIPVLAVRFPSMKVSD